MKTLIDKLAAGVSTYEMPDAEVLENRIAVELETGDYKPQIISHLPLAVSIT